jgi:hypothetical protein
MSLALREPGSNGDDGDMYFPAAANFAAKWLDAISFTGYP